MRKMWTNLFNNNPEKDRDLMILGIMVKIQRICIVTIKFLHSYC